jgi:hypothetical protein
MSEMRIALEVRLYEDVLYELHNELREAGGCDHTVNICVCPLIRLIRHLEANAYEVTWKRAGAAHFDHFRDGEGT